MALKKPTYEQLLARNAKLINQAAALNEEVNLLRKSFLPEESYYKDRFYRITENVNDVVYRLKLPECRYEYISPQAKDMFGYESSSIYDAPLLIRKIVHPDSLPYFLEQWRLLLAGNAPDYYEIKIIRKDGKERWVQQKNLIIRSKNGEPVAIEGIVTDITARKLAEEALINSESVNKAILNNLPHLAWLKDTDGKYLSVNESFAASVNRTIEEIIGKTDFDLYPKEAAEQYVEEDKQICITKKKLNVEEESNGHWWETFKAPIFDHDGKLIAVTGIALEITKRKANEEKITNYSEKLSIHNVKLKLINDELKSAKEKAEGSDKLKSAFLANMSHEIRTPMNAILGFATLIRNRVLSEEKKRDYIDLIHTNCRQLLHIITDIIDISKIEADQISIFSKNFFLNKLMNDLFMNYKNQIEVIGKPIELKIKNGLKDEDSAIVTDKVRLEQILSNLLSNALKFTDKGYIELGYLVDKKNLVFHVKDTGIGITAEEQDIVFDRFRQVSVDFNRVYGGTGLGLSICKGLAERLDGEIWVESTQGKGSKFFLSIPFKPGVQMNKPAEIDYTNAYRWSGKTLLIAEDEETNYNLLESILAPTKAKILWAKTGLEAVEMCQNRKSIDIVLMDIKMPGMDGFEATKKIKANRKELPVLAQTAYAMSTDEENCLQAGCDDYIAKPIRIDDLLYKVDRMLFLKPGELEKYTNSLKSSSAIK